MILERCKVVHCVDLGESFHMSIYLQNVASISPRTNLVKFARSPCTDPSGIGNFGGDVLGCIEFDVSETRTTTTAQFLNAGPFLMTCVLETL